MFVDCWPSYVCYRTGECSSFNEWAGSGCVGRHIPDQPRSDRIDILAHHLMRRMGQDEEAQRLAAHRDRALSRLGTLGWEQRPQA
jgi:hypothetical protein